jgi:HD-like signal output (HDOD) protein
MESPELPSLPVVAVEVLERTRDPDVSVHQIAQVVANDQALSLKILRTINSSFYGLRRPCPTIDRAVGLLGINPLRTLVLGFGLVDVTSRGAGGLDLMDYWRRSLSCAAAARRVAARVDGCDADEAFLAALVQDVGMLAMGSVIGPKYERAVSLTAGNHGRLPEVEAGTFGFHHAEAGEALAVRWRLPESLLDPIRHHHGLNGDADADRLATRVCHLANRIDLVMTGQASADDLRAVIEAGRRDLDLGPEAMVASIRGSAEDAREMAQLFRVEIGAGDLDDVLAEAHARLAACGGAEAA